MEKHYPASDIAIETVYDQMIDGRFKNRYRFPAYKNTCPVRMSYVLNRNGLKLGVAPNNDGDTIAAKGYRYWIRASDPKPYVVRQFKDLVPAEFDQCDAFSKEGAYPGKY